MTNSSAHSQQPTDNNNQAKLPLWREPAVWLGLLGAIGGVLVLILAGWFDPLIQQ